MRHGGYDVLRRALTRDRTIEGQDIIVEEFLAKFDEKDSQGRYINDIEEWNPSDMYRACFAADQDDAYANKVSLEESGSIATGSFTQAFSGLLNKMILRSYDQKVDEANFIGDQLVEIQKGINRKDEKLLRFSSLPLLKYVAEEEAPEPFKMDETYYGYKLHKFAREISVTKEVLLFDQTGQIWAKAKALGAMGPETREIMIVESFMDLQGSRYGSDQGIPAGEQYVYYPEGVATDLYSASSPTGISSDGNIISSNGLNDYSNISAVRTRMRNFLDDVPERLKDSSSNNGRRIRTQGTLLVVAPEALQDRIWLIQNTMNKLDSANNNANPSRKGGLRAFNFVTSRILDDDSPSTWYAGYPKQQMRFLEAMPFAVGSINRRASVDLLRRDIVGVVVAKAMYGVAASDNKYVIKNTA